MIELNWVLPEYLFRFDGMSDSFSLGVAASSIVLPS